MAGKGSLVEAALSSHGSDYSEEVLAEGAVGDVSAPGTAVSAKKSVKKKKISLSDDIELMKEGASSSSSPPTCPRPSDLPLRSRCAQS